MNSRQCPACGQAMANGRMGPVSLDLCRSCGGVWFDLGGLQQVLQAGAPVVRRLAEAVGGTGALPPAGSRSRCPACQVPLAAVEYPSMAGLRLDSCQFCHGYWLLRPALQHIALVLERAQQPVPAAAAGPAAPASGYFSAPSPAPAPAAPSGGYLSVPTPTAPGAWPQAPPATPPDPTRPPIPDVYADQRVALERAQRLEAQAKAEARAQSGTPQLGKQPGKPPPTAAGEPCPECGEANPPGAPVCWACSHMLRGKVEGTCPKCLGNMLATTSSGVRLLACEGCGGVWIEDGRLSALVIQPWETQDELLKNLKRLRTGRVKKYQQELMCTKDKLLLFPTPFGMMSRKPIDTCPQCRGSFLEYSQLDEILVAQRR